MTKTELISRILKIYPYMSASNVNQIISIVLNKIVDTVKDGNRVELRGFGTFGVKRRGTEKKRNPKTGEVVFINDRTVPFFRSGKQLKIFVNSDCSYNDKLSMTSNVRKTKYGEDHLATFNSNSGSIQDVAGEKKKMCKIQSPKTSIIKIRRIFKRNKEDD